MLLSPGVRLICSDFSNLLCLIYRVLGNPTAQLYLKHECRCSWLGVDVHTEFVSSVVSV